MRGETGSPLLQYKTPQGESLIRRVSLSRLVRAETESKPGSPLATFESIGPKGPISRRLE